MPKNTNILMIRHGEKPDDGKGLAVAGQARAQAYVVYFQNYVLDAEPIKLDYIFATRNSNASHRPVLTVTPLAEALDLKIHHHYEDKDYEKLAEEILGDSKYDGQNILVCWHHGKLLELADALGVGKVTLPPESHWPAKPWPGKVFGWVLQLCYDADGDLVPAQTVCLNQKLMYDDYGQGPPLDD
jgi:hypothetical protein